MKRTFIITLLVLFTTLSFFGQEYKEKGKKDTLVIEIDDHNRLYIPDIYPSDYADENPTDEMFISADKFNQKGSLDITFAIWAIEGEIENNIIIFDVVDDFKITGGRCKKSKVLVFSEDGSGGVLSESESYFSEWVTAEIADGEILIIPSFEEADDPVIPEDEYTRAEEMIAENPNLSYSEYYGGVLLEMSYIYKGKVYVKEINFYNGFGD